jgi:hypothetical protein
MLVVWAGSLHGVCSLAVFLRMAGMLDMARLIDFGGAVRIRKLKH